MNDAIKLRAADEQDLQVIAACLQDAIVPISEIGYLAQEQVFLLLANRFKWESVSRTETASDECFLVDLEDTPLYERVHSLFRVEGVTRVLRRNIDLADRSTLLNLLTISCHDDGLLLTFAGEQNIWLQSGRWSCSIEDLGDSWPSWAKPHHDQREQPCD